MDELIYKLEELVCDRIKDTDDATLVCDAINAINALSKPGWIPVTERLPSYGDWVLGIGPKKGYYVCEYRGVTQWRRDGCDPWFSAKGSSVTITHWMPLPQPPKEE